MRMRKLKWMLGATAGVMLGHAMWAAAVPLESPLRLAAGAECKFEQNRSGGDDAGDIEKVVLLARAGHLDVQGSLEAKRIDASGRACASSQALLDEIVLKTHRAGRTLYIEAIMPELQDLAWFGSNYARLDLRVTLPSSLPVEVQDSSGEAVLENLKSLKMQDSSGDLTIRRVAGAVDVEDSSGGIAVKNVGGDFTVREDSSGGIQHHNVRGRVSLPGGR